MQKKVLFSIVAVALFGVVIAFNVNQNHDSQSERLVKNVEALATVDGDHDEDNSEESGGCGGGCHDGVPCYMACCHPADPGLACLWCDECCNADNGKVPCAPSYDTC